MLRGLSLGIKDIFGINSIHDNRCLLPATPLLESYLRGCLNKLWSPVLTERPPEMTRCLCLFLNAAR